MAAVSLGAQTAVTTNAASYNSGAFTTPNDGLSRLLVAICELTGQTATDWAVTDNVGGSPGWTKIRRQLKNTSADIQEVWVRNGLIAPNTAVTVTFSHASGNATGGAVRVWQITGITRTGSSAVRSQGGQDNQAASTTPAPALNQAARTGNPTLTGVFNATNPNANTITGWTAETAEGWATPTTGTRGFRRDSGFTGTTLTYDQTSASAFCSVAVEIDSSVATTVTADAGTYALTGQLARVAIASMAAVGVYLVSGKVASVGRVVSFPFGVYAWGGSSVRDTITGRVVVGTFAWVGAAATTVFTSGKRSGSRWRRRLYRD